MYIDIDGIETGYLSLGEETPVTVVMLHGWGANSGLFYNAAENISSKYRVVAPDFPGFGETPEPDSDWTVDDYTDFTVRFISVLGLKRVILLGHSFGGRVIIKLNNRDDLPFVIEKNIMVDAAGIKPEKTAEQEKKEKVAKFGKKLFSHTPGLLDKVKNLAGSEDYRNASPRMKEILKNVVNEDLTGLLPGVKPSTLLVWGTADTATPIADAEKMEKLMPDAGLARIEGGSHFSFLDYPALFNAIINAFI